MLQRKKETHIKAKQTLAVFGIRALEHPAQACDDETMPRPARVLGPYRDGKAWRVVVLEGSTRKAVTVETLEKAEHLKAEMLRALTDQGARSVGAAIEEYFAFKRESGLHAASLETLAYKLKGFLPLDASLRSVTPQRAQTLYDQERARVTKFGRPVSVATHRLLLRSTKRFFRWVVSKGYLAANPFEKVEPIGKINSGKRQLTKDEAIKLTDILAADAERGDEAALALLTQLFLGLRSSEILLRNVRDLDDNGRILSIPFGKSKNARRRLEIPERLRALLLRQAEGKAPTALLFGAERAEPFATDKLWDKLQRYCKNHGLPRVCPHSLRGLHSTLALDAGISANAVAAALGHGSFAVTARHYADPNTLRNTTVRRFAETLEGPKPGSLSREDLIAALSVLAPAERDAIFRAVAERA